MGFVIRELKSTYTETLVDGMQVYHNPFADNPLDPVVFRSQVIVQHNYSHDAQEWIYEGVAGALMCRRVITEKKPRDLGPWA